MTKKKACKKGCAGTATKGVDCDECLIKQQIKKQKLCSNSVLRS